MRRRVPVFYDFASSLCYVADQVMQRMKNDLEVLDLALEWKPIDLTRITGWRIGAAFEGTRRENALRVARELEVPLRLPPRWLDTRTAMATALVLDGSAEESAWRARVWRAVYLEGLDPGEPDAVPGLERELGVEVSDEDRIRALTDLELRTRDAANAEVAGVPTFILNGFPIGGIQEEQTMRSLLERYALRTRRLH